MVVFVAGLSLFLPLGCSTPTTDHPGVAPPLTSSPPPVHCVRSWTSFSVDGHDMVSTVSRRSLSVRAPPTLLPGATDPANDVSTCAKPSRPTSFHNQNPRSPSEANRGLRFHPRVTRHVPSIVERSYFLDLSIYFTRLPSRGFRGSIPEPVPMEIF